MSQFDFLRSLRLLLPALLYLVVSLVCTQFPLLNYLGYEFSAIIALLGSFIAGFTTIREARELLRNEANRPMLQESPAPIFKSLWLNLLLLVIPLVVMLTNAFFVKNCSLFEGLAFLALIPVVSVVFSWALGFFCAAHYGWAKIAFTAIVFATFAEVLALGYFTPAIFSYNFFFGYFPGLTYDEVLGISSSLVLFRILTLALAAALVWMAMLLARNTNPEDSFWNKGVTLLGVMVQGKNVVVTAAFATLVIVCWWFRGELGFDSSSGFIQKSLGSKYETEHFRIFYSAESYDADEITWIAGEHEFRLKQISDALALPYKMGSPKSDSLYQKIESYVYPSSSIKHKLMGAGNTNIAKPWSRQIHITRQSLDGTLKHELVHVMAAPFGVPVINASLSTGLVEGLAMAIEWDWGNRTLHQYSAAMQRLGLATNVMPIMSITGFASQSSSISYVLAGSFSRYLIDKYGIRKMMMLYRSNEYEQIYGTTLKALNAEWQEFLKSQPFADEDRDVIDVLFRRPPIFKKVCARVIAARNTTAAALFRNREYAQAQQLYQQSYNDGRGYDALSGMMTSALYAKDFATLTSLLDTMVLKDSRPSQYLPLFVNAGIAFWAEGNRSRARELFTRVEAADLQEYITESSILCRSALEDSINQDKFLRYFLTVQSDTARIVSLDSMTQHSQTHWVPMYLKGRALIRLQRFDEAVDNLEQISLENKRVEAIRLKTIGYAKFRLKRFEEAKSAYWRSLNVVATNVAKNEVDEWVERCDFFAQRFALHGETR
jgi:tetratricopeptide (TPR) repeat protein